MTQPLKAELPWLQQQVRAHARNVQLILQGGSRANKQALKGSDNDVVGLGKHAHQPGSSNLISPEGQKVDLMVHDNRSLGYIFNEEAESGRGTLLQIVSHSIVLFEAHEGQGRFYQQEAMARYLAGPLPVTKASLTERLQSLSADADEVAQMPAGPARHLAAQLLASRVGYTAQRAARVWSAKRGKILARRLAIAMPDYKHNLEEAAATLATGNALAMHRIINSGISQMYHEQEIAGLHPTLSSTPLSVKVEHPAEPASVGEAFYYARRSPTAMLDYLESGHPIATPVARQWQHCKYATARAAVTTDRMKRPHGEYNYAVTGLAGVIIDMAALRQGIIPTERDLPASIATAEAAMPGFAVAVMAARHGQPEGLIRRGDFAVRAISHTTPEALPAPRPSPSWARVPH